MKRTIKSFKENIDHMQKAIRKKEFSQSGALNEEFHKIIYQACPFKRLCKMIFDLWDEMERGQPIFCADSQEGQIQCSRTHGDPSCIAKKRRASCPILNENSNTTSLKGLESYLNSDKFRKEVFS